MTVIDAVFECSVCDGKGGRSGFTRAGIPGRIGSAGPMVWSRCGSCEGTGYDLVEGCCALCGEPVSSEAIIDAEIVKAKAAGWEPDPPPDPLPAVWSRSLPEGALTKVFGRGRHRCQESA